MACFSSHSTLIVRAKNCAGIQGGGRFQQVSTAAAISSEALPSPLAASAQVAPRSAPTPVERFDDSNALLIAVPGYMCLRAGLPCASSTAGDETEHSREGQTRNSISIPIFRTTQAAGIVLQPTPSMPARAHAVTTKQPVYLFMPCQARSPPERINDRRVFVVLRCL